jgi:hypothetical protein
MPESAELKLQESLKRSPNGKKSGRGFEVRIPEHGLLSHFRRFSLSRHATTVTQITAETRSVRGGKK